LVSIALVTKRVIGLSSCSAYLRQYLNSPPCEAVYILNIIQIIFSTV